MQTKLPDLEDTIVALSSAVGPAARAIVRLSGRRASAIAAEVCPEFEPQSLPRGHFFAGKLRLAPFAALIPADLYRFVAPHSYTGQDMIELHLISCQPIVEALIAACLNAGAREAQPGEFTLRAFLAGKLDLTRAEAVLGVIEARDQSELKQALKQLAGGIAQPLAELREDLLNLLADVEAGLDFSEENLHFVTPDVMLARLAKGLAYLTLLRRQIDQRALSQRPFRVVLAGAPNAGKSSLFNALAGNDQALVSAEPGTTRDYLETTIAVEDVTFHLLDTAGMRSTMDAIEADAQELGRDQLGQADLILWCVPLDEETLPAIGEVETWIIATKADRVSAEIAGATSAVTGQGVAELRERLLERVRSSAHAPLAPSLSRCRHHIDVCLQRLRHAHTVVLNEEMPELLALEIRLALEEMGALAGTVYTEDLLDRIFSRFCIGK